MFQRVYNWLATSVRDPADDWKFSNLPISSGKRKREQTLFVMSVENYGNSTIPSNDGKFKLFEIFFATVTENITKFINGTKS